MSDFQTPQSAEVLKSPMNGLSAHHLRFAVQPNETIVFNEHPGPALRGALYNVLTQQFCSEPNGPTTPEHRERCPVCWMLASENGWLRGQNTPRPLTVQPPMGHTFHPNRTLTFGFTLIGQAQDLLPYLARAAHRMGEVGVGRGRGRFDLLRISEYSPLLDAERVLMKPGMTPNIPTLQVNAHRIAEAAQAWSGRETLRLEFLTPTRLIADGRLVQRPDLVILIRRLIERCQSLVTYYGQPEQGMAVDWKVLDATLSAAAALAKLTYDDTEWLDIWSHSRRTDHTSPIGGMVGLAQWHIPALALSVLISWLLWGQSLQVGKDAVKGNGWYRLVWV